MGIHEVKTAPRSPWQNPYVERLIGTLRRECLDHIVVLNETHLRRLLRDYLAYYHTGLAPVPWTLFPLGEEGVHDAEDATAVPTAASGATG